MAIDANAMYQAGFGSKSTGRNVRVDERNARNAAITKTAFNILGQAAIGQIKQNYRGLQEYRNLSDSQTSLLNLQVDKMPASNGEYYVGENESLKGSILELKSLYDAAARKASFGFGKNRSKGRQDMTRYMKQLSDMNAVLEIYKTSREKSKAMLGVLSGVTNSDEGVKTISAGSNAFEVDSTTQQSTGALGARLRWNIETGEMEVQVGGEWQIDKETGLNTYKDKAETGTYEEYVAEDTDMAYQSYKNDNNSLISPEMTQEEWSESRGTEQGLNTSLLSREEWTKQNQENRVAVSRILYKNMKFAVEADGMMADTMRGLKSDILKASYKANAVSWERVSEIYYGELQSKIGGYNDDQFKDYYFGGDTFDHSSGRMSESAPAYQRLLAEDKNADPPRYENGVFAKGYGPGSTDWEGRLLALKGQSFVKGSSYRKEATDKIFQGFKKQYKDNVAAYKEDNPVLNPEDTKTTWDTSYNRGLSRSRADLFVNKVKNGAKVIKDLRGYDGKTHTWELQSNGKYLAIDGDKKLIRTKEEMLIENELESYYPEIFASFSEDEIQYDLYDPEKEKAKNEEKLKKRKDAFDEVIRVSSYLDEEQK